MANVITYNQVIELLIDITKRHEQVNTFYLGRNWEIENSEDILFPLFQVYPDFGRLSVNAYNEYKTQTIRFVCKMVDLTTNGESNERDVHSDTLRYAQDIVNEFNQHPFYMKSNIKLIGDIDFNEVLEEYQDDVTAGWTFNLTFQLINLNQFCGMPIQDIPGYSATGPTSTGTIVNTNFLTCETLEFCPTIINIEAELEDHEIRIEALEAGGGGGSQTLAQTLGYGNSTGGNAIVSDNGNQTVTIDDSNINIFASIPFYTSNIIVAGSQISLTSNTILLTSNNINLPSLTTDTLLYLDSSKNIRSVSLGAGLTLVAGVLTNSAVAVPQSLADTLAIGNSTNNISITAGTNLSNLLQVSDTVMGMSWNGTIGGNITLDDTGTYVYSDTSVFIESQLDVNITGPIVNINTSDYFNSYSTLGPSWSNIYHDSGGNITIATVDAAINFYSGGGYTIPNNGSNNVIVINDTQSSKGLVYEADYSANFTPESLVSKRYVLATIASSTPSLSGTAPIVYTAGNISITQATTSTNGYLSSTDWNTFNNKQPQLNGTGFVKVVGTTVSYDNSTYALASSLTAYVPYTGATTDLDMGTHMASADTLRVTGTAGTGYLRLPNQSVTPSAPTISLRMFADSLNRLSWIGLNGYTRTFDGTSNTANRIYVLPDNSGTVALISDLTTGYVPYTGATTNVNLGSNNFTVTGSITTGMSGSASRVVEAGSGGALTATKDIIDGFLLAGSAPAILLTNVANWTAKVYTGTAITGTYQGQQFFDNNYYFVAVNDNDWIRTARA